MKIFAIGDLHLSFGPGVEKPMDRFGEEWVNHAERLRANWMKEISPVDTVIICGDISWGLRLEEAAADFEWIRGLPGKTGSERRGAAASEGRCPCGAGSMSTA